MRPKEGAVIYTYYKQSCEKTPQSTITHHSPNSHSTSRTATILKGEENLAIQSKQNSPLQESVTNTGRKKEALKRAENPKPKKTPPHQK
jgi:hypothetical protein